MRRWLQVVGIIVGALALLVGGLSYGWHKPLAAVYFISPPEAALPVGQGVEVRYKADMDATLELRVALEDANEPSDLIAVDRVRRGQEVAHFWAPATEGRRCLIVTASAISDTGKKSTLGSVRRCITALPAGSPVRLNRR